MRAGCLTFCHRHTYEDRKSIAAKIAEIVSWLEIHRQEVIYNLSNKGLGP